MPSSVDASAETGTTDKPCSASGATCSSRFSLDRLTATTVAPAWAAMRVIVVPMPPPPAPDTTTMRPSSLRRSSMSYCPDNIWCSAYCRTLFRSGYRPVKAGQAAASALLSGLEGLDSVRGHDCSRDVIAPALPVHRPQPDRRRGWRLERLTAPSRLFGANGLRTGPDGRVYVAQVTGSQISALDLASGEVEAISPKGGEIIAPDDVAFDASGNLYATEVMDGRVSVREAGGAARVLRDDLPCANGITVHQDRLFINECRDGGRLMELDRATGASRILLEDLPSPNAMEVGPDGLLYYPLMTANEIWRIRSRQAVSRNG